MKKSRAAKPARRSEITTKRKINPAIKMGKLSQNTVKRIVDAVVRSRKKK